MKNKNNETKHNILDIFRIFNFVYNRLDMLHYNFFKKIVKHSDHNIQICKYPPALSKLLIFFSPVEC